MGIVMLLEIGHLKDDPGEYEYYDFEFSPEETDEDCVMLSPVHVTGSVTYGGNGYLVAGKLSAKTQIPCSRCLAPVDQDLAFDFDEEFEEQEFPEEDAVIDLFDVAAQIWVTAVPMQVLCDDECKGLCPQCGKNLNEGECGCQGSEVDPRLEILRGYTAQGDAKSEEDK
ncbi:MAG: DUF177 domain-containing protein [Clostridiales bacterium]|nr:DUF177 domain-containing protein [Clostridiales bacterium]